MSSYSVTGISMGRARAACLRGALLAALSIAAPPGALADQFDPQKYFEAKAKEAAAQQPQKAPQKAWKGEAAQPLSGGSAMIGSVTGGTWIAIGVGAGLVALSVVLWLKVPSLNLEPRVDDHIDKEFRAMIEETGEDPFSPEHDSGRPRRAPLNEADIIEDLTGEQDHRAGGLAGGGET